MFSSSAPVKPSAYYCVLLGPTMDSNIVQDRVETWLKKNEQFTNNFVLDWVKNHPELHLALFYSNSSFIRPHAPVLPDKIVDSTNSKDSGVEDDQVQPELSVEKGLSTLKIQDVEDELDLETVAVHQVQSDYEPLQVLDIHPETIRAERIEAMLDMSGHLHARLFAPQQIIARVMHSAQLFLRCTVVNILLNEALPFINPNPPRPGILAVELSRAFVITTVSEYELPRKVDESIVPYLAEVADQTEQTGLTFVVDEADHMICLRLKSYWGMVVGFLLLMYSEEEFERLTELDLMYLQMFSQICGTAIDNTFTVSTLTKYSSRLCEYATGGEFDDTKIPKYMNDDSLSSFETLSGSQDDLPRSYSCPELQSSCSKPNVTSHQSL